MNPHSSTKTNKPTFSALKAHDLKLQTHIDATCDHLDFVDISSALRNKTKSLDNGFVVVSNRPEIMIYLELISNTRDNRTLRSAMTYKIHASLTITNLNCIQPLHQSEIKYQGEALSILCAMRAHGLKPEVEFSNFLALQISNG